MVLHRGRSTGGGMAALRAVTRVSAERLTVGDEFGGPRRSRLEESAPLGRYQTVPGTREQPTRDGRYRQSTWGTSCVGDVAERCRRWSRSGERLVLARAMGGRTGRDVGYCAVQAGPAQRLDGAGRLRKDSTEGRRGYPERGLALQFNRFRNSYVSS